MALRTISPSRDGALTGNQTFPVGVHVLIAFVVPEAINVTQQERGVGWGERQVLFRITQELVLWVHAEVAPRDPDRHRRNSPFVRDEALRRG